MDAEFWHERWARDEIGFHEHDYNAHMTSFMGSLALSAGAHVLVPLCGKSKDLLWLHEQGFRVSGIELSLKAIEDFFQENGLEYERTETGGMHCFHHGTLSIYGCDIFQADFSLLGEIDGVYDRAALVALPPDMRNDYASLIQKILLAGTPVLLVTLDYDQAEMPGPPFSVPAQTVKDLYDARCTIEEIHAEDCLDNEPHFRKKGLSKLTERVYRITRKGA